MVMMKIQEGTIKNYRSLKSINIGRLGKNRRLTSSNPEQLWKGSQIFEGSKKDMYGALLEMTKNINSSDVDIRKLDDLISQVVPKVDNLNEDVVSRVNEIKMLLDNHFGELSSI